MENKKIRPAYLDDNVILTMVITSLVALIITGFQYKNYEHCFSFNIKAKAEHFRTGELIQFETNAPYARNFNWDFGDNENNETKINSVVHSYNQPGEYTISLILNGTCSEYKTIYISKAPKVANPLLIPTFVCPQSAKIGTAVTFSDTTQGARSWEWRFGETTGIDAISATASYVYKSPGLKTISLVINNNPEQIGICKVYVNDTPAPDRKKENIKQRNKKSSPFVVIPAKPGTPTLEEQLNKQPAIVLKESQTQGVSIDKQEFESKLRMVINNFYKAENFAPYLCNNLNIPVSLNGSEITFIQLCNKLGSIKSEKKIRQLNVQQIKSNETNCIIGLNVRLKLKQGFLGIF